MRFYPHSISGMIIASKNLGIFTRVEENRANCLVVTASQRSCLPVTAAGCTRPASRMSVTPVLLLNAYVRNADDACSDYGISALQFMLIYMRDGLHSRNLQQRSQSGCLSLASFLDIYVYISIYLYSVF